MKARVKATGEIVTITGTDGICLTDENGHYHLIGNLEGCEVMPDYWKKLTHQYAGQFLQGMIISKPFTRDYVEDAYQYATSLVNKLKEDS